jgi:hypothetical protein
MTDVVTVYHIYPELCCDAYRYVLTDAPSESGVKAVSLTYEEKSFETKEYKGIATVTLTLTEATVVHELLGKLL